MILVPEISTMFSEMGVSLGEAGRRGGQLAESLERERLRLQGEMRRTARRQAAALEADGERCVILLDRAEMDSMAFIGPKLFWKLIAELGLDAIDVRDSYHTVIHLNSVAVGAEQAYSLENNKARTEDLEQARKVDQLTLQSWIGHPRLRVIGNEADFELKLRHLLTEACEALELPPPGHGRRRWLLARRPPERLIKNARRVFTEVVFLTGGQNERAHLRRRTQAGATTYFLHHRAQALGVLEEERERVITQAEFEQLRERRDPLVANVYHDRYCLMESGHYLEFDHVQAGPRRFWTLEVEIQDPQAVPQLPEEVDLRREITDDPSYRDRTLASD